MFCYDLEIGIIKFIILTQKKRKNKLYRQITDFIRYTGPLNLYAPYIFS